MIVNQKPTTKELTWKEILSEEGVYLLASENYNYDYIIVLKNSEGTTTTLYYNSSSQKLEPTIASWSNCNCICRFKKLNKNVFLKIK